MNAPPPLEGHKLHRWSPIDERQRHTGSCRQIVAGVIQGAAAGLMICELDGEGLFFLYGCDANWDVVTDTCHFSLEEAMGQAEFEYEGISKTWMVG